MRSLRPWVFIMIAPETFSHIEHIKKRAGHLWRFL
jgi:peptide chain release factor 2